MCVYVCVCACVHAYISLAGLLLSPLDYKMDFFPVLKCSETLTADRSALSPSIHSQRDIEGAVVGDEDLVFVPSDAGWGVARSNAF